MKVDKGSTNVSIFYYIVEDVGGTNPGEPKTGLLFSDIETGGSASYARQGATRVDLTLITLASAAAAHADGGFILVDNTNMPGLYRCDYPDAAFASGVDVVTCQIVIAAAKNAIARPVQIDLDTVMRGTDGANTTTPLTAAAVNAEVSDVLKTDTITLPGQAAPPLEPTFEQALAWLYKVFRNRKEQTGGTWSLMADNGTTQDSKATVSDDGTIAIKQEIVAGT